MRRMDMYDPLAFAAPIRAVDPSRFAPRRIVDPTQFAPGLRAGSGDGSPRFSDGGSGRPELDAPEGVNLDALAELLRTLGDIPAIQDAIASGVLDDIPGYEGIESWDDLLTVTGFGGASERGFDALGGASYSGRAGKRNRDVSGFGVGRLGLVSDGGWAGVPWAIPSSTQGPMQLHSGRPHWPNMDAGVPESADAGTDAPDGGVDAPDGGPDAPDGGHSSTYVEGYGEPTSAYSSRPGYVVLEYGGGMEEGGITVARAAEPGEPGYVEPVGSGDAGRKNPNPDANPSLAELTQLFRILGYFHPATFWGAGGSTDPRRVRPDRETGPNPWGPRLAVPGLADEPQRLRARPSGAGPTTRGEFARRMWGGHGPRPTDPAMLLQRLAGVLNSAK